MSVSLESDSCDNLKTKYNKVFLVTKYLYLQNSISETDYIFNFLVTELRVENQKKIKFCNDEHWKKIAYLQKLDKNISVKKMHLSAKFQLSVSNHLMTKKIAKSSKFFYRVWEKVFA